MRLLLIAYEFPPAFTPQALRWIRFCGELLKRGWDVHVLAPDLYLPESADFAAPSGLTIHRSHPGWFTGAISARRRARRQREAGDGTAEPDPGQGSTAQAMAPGPASSRVRLNWKGRAHAGMRSVLNAVTYPDSRAEWLGSARKRLDDLLDTLAPDVVVSSHEPAVTLQLGLHAQARGFRWLADLGDPVLAGYTRWHWRRRAHRLEAAVCRHANAVTVTNEATRALLIRRHAVDEKQITVVGQGYSPAPSLAGHQGQRPPSRELSLLYTGRFYSFRDPRPLFAAINATPGVTLTVAAPELPRSVERHFSAPDSRLRFAGALSHRDVSILQRQSDVLVNIGNRDPTQTPGKVYEYFGACRPILHLTQREPDPVVAEIAARRRGWSCLSRVDSIQAVLQRLVELRQAGELHDDLDLSETAVADCTWAARAQLLAARLEQVLAMPARQAMPLRTQLQRLAD